MLETRSSVACDACTPIAAASRTNVAVSLIATAWIALAAVRVADAQCAFEHPKKAGQVQASLVQAFVSCDCYEDCCPIPIPPYFACGPVCGNTTAAGHTACKPPETFCEQSANRPGDGWEWDENLAAGSVALKSVAFCAGTMSGTTLPACSPSDPLNSAQGGAADLSVALKVKGVLTSGTQQPASGTGMLSLVLRMTVDDPGNGDASVVDFPASAPFDLVDGKAKLVTSLDAILNSQNLPGMPPCASIELVSLRVLDQNGDGFATIGILLPSG